MLKPVAQRRPVPVSSIVDENYDSSNTPSSSGSSSQRYQSLLKNGFCAINDQNRHAFQQQQQQQQQQYFKKSMDVNDKLRGTLSSMNVTPTSDQRSFSSSLSAASTASAPVSTSPNSKGIIRSAKKKFKKIFGKPSSIQQDENKISYMSPRRWMGCHPDQEEENGLWKQISRDALINSDHLMELSQRYQQRQKEPEEKQQQQQQPQCADNQKKLSYAKSLVTLAMMHSSGVASPRRAKNTYEKAMKVLEGCDGFQPLKVTCLLGIAKLHESNKNTQLAKRYGEEAAKILKENDESTSVEYARVQDYLKQLKNIEACQSPNQRQQLQEQSVYTPKLTHKRLSLI